MAKSSTAVLIMIQAISTAAQSSFCYDLKFGDTGEWFDAYGYGEDLQWFDGYGYTCSWYSEADHCAQYGGNEDAEHNGMKGDEACCACGGGSLPDAEKRTSRILPIAAPTTDSGNFNWGVGCSAGADEFDLDLPVRFGLEDVGLIPAGKFDVEVWMTARNDLDITLFDVSDTSAFPEGRAIVQWCSPDDLDAGENCGLLGQGQRRDEVFYKGMRIIYSGFDGVGNKKGNEFVRILGETTVPLMMKAYAYQTGRAKVSYNWDNSRTACCKGEPNACGGTFTATLAEDQILTIGTIPMGKQDLRVTLKAENGVDIDVQLYDLDDTSEWAQGQAIVAYCAQSLTCNYGLTTTAGPPPPYVYYDRTYTYSGYDGVNGNPGDEFIAIEGVTNRNLLMSFYGYKAGTATVVYSYTEPQDHVRDRVGMKIIDSTV